MNCPSNTDIEFDGFNFGTDATRISLAYGPIGVIPPPFVCAVLSVSDNTVRFSTAAAGEGTHLVFRISVAGQIAIGMPFIPAENKNRYIIYGRVGFLTQIFSHPFLSFIPFHINVQPFSGSDFYQYPSVPCVTAVHSRGCKEAGNSIYNCDTVGGVTLNITGVLLNAPLVITVAQAGCTNVVYDASGTWLTCRMGAGTGYNQSIVVAQNALYRCSLVI